MQVLGNGGISSGSSILPMGQRILTPSINRDSIPLSAS
uniref:Uncharacterized protein n=1 Tax=Arundo donax TaxID=35708 RepID=A0A0A9ED01_ARUDO